MSATGDPRRDEDVVGDRIRSVFPVLDEQEGIVASKGEALAALDRLTARLERQGINIKALYKQRRAAEARVHTLEQAAEHVLRVYDLGDWPFMPGMDALRAVVLEGREEPKKRKWSELTHAERYPELEGQEQPAITYEGLKALHTEMLEGREEDRTTE